MLTSDESEEDAALHTFPSLTRNHGLFSRSVSKWCSVLPSSSVHRRTEPREPGADVRLTTPEAHIPRQESEELLLPDLPELKIVEQQTSLDSESRESVQLSLEQSRPAHTPKASDTRSSSLFQPKLLVDALHESSIILLNGIREQAGKLPGPPVLKHTLGATLGVCTGGLLCAFPAHSLGVLSALSVFAALGLEKNHHIRAQGIIGGILFAAHFVAMDVPAAAICSVLATTRATLQAMLPEERIHARGVMAAAGFGVAAATCGLFTNLLPLAQLGNVPLLTMALGSIAGAFTQKYSWATRLCSVLSMGLSIPYHIFESLSAAGVLINLVLLPRALHSIWRFDVAKRPACSEATALPAATPDSAQEGASSEFPIRQ